MKFCIMTLGCKVNSYESEFIKEKFIENGFRQVKIDDEPDVIVVNTCSVTNQSDAKSRHMIRLARKKSKDAILVVAGCSAQNHQKALFDLGVNILLGNKDKSKIVSYVNDFIKNKKNIERFYDLKCVPFEDMMLQNEQDKTRAFVKIQDGCDNFCAYCIIPYMRGNIRSKDIDVAFREIECLVEKGHSEIVLTGIHTGSYGRGTDYDLVDLIRMISKLEKLKRIRISSIEITELNDKFIDELKNNPKICDHLHIPLQSGCDKILGLMNRKYTTSEFLDKISLIRSIRPDISITTDLIVGFPYETDEDFGDTFKFLQEVKFTKIHTFPFSLRSKTKAEEMKDGFVDEKTKKERVKKVLELSKSLEGEYYKKFIGKSLSIIIENSESEYSRGHSSNYIMVNTDKKLEEGSTVRVKIESVDELVVNGKYESVE